jgi:hypothetical protein
VKITKNNMAKYISKLCKENNPDACVDCSNLRCECYCHKEDEENTCEMLERGISFDD